MTLLAEGRCAEAREAARALPRVYRAGAAACLAALGGRDDLWHEAADIADVQPPLRDCFERAVWNLIKGLVTAHRQYPKAALRPKPASPGATIACPRIIKVVPGHGPAAGGYPLRLIGVHLPSRFNVHFYWSVDVGNPVQLIATGSSDGKEAVIEAPPLRLGADRSVAVFPDGWPLEVLNSAEFHYDAPNKSPTSPPTTPHQSPSTTASSAPPMSLPSP